MPPDPTTILTALGLGKYAAALIALAMCIGYIITWLAPLMTVVPKNGFLLFLYNVVQKIAGNVGGAKNAVTPETNTVISVPRNLSFAFAMSLTLGMLIVLSACSQSNITTALATPAGQLFCAVQTAGGGTVVAGLIDAEASSAAPGAAPLAILATGAAKSTVDADCAAAGGVAVSPPANPATAPQIAVVPAG